MPSTQPPLYTAQVLALLRQQDTNANRYTLRCLAYTVAAFFLIWLLNTTGVFIVEKELMTTSFLLGSAVLLTPILVTRISGCEPPWVKYLILGAVEAALIIVGTTLTFHAVLLFALPLFYAAQYSNKRLIYLAYAATVASLFISVMAGYFLGLCDLNMLLLSKQSTAYYTALFSDPTTAIPLNSSVWITLPLFFVLPRAIILLIFVPVIRHTSNRIASGAVRLMETVRMGETDQVTRFFNKAKCNDMVSNYYPTVDRVGVIFWDINHLKEINDTYGHSSGDTVIADIASCIYEQTDDRRLGYRIGGDEFIMILEDPRPSEIDEIIAAFQQKLTLHNKHSQLIHSAAIGSAEGPGTQVRDVIRKADAAMYVNKRQLQQITV